MTFFVQFLKVVLFLEREPQVCLLIVLEPLNEGDDGIIIEFKVHDPEDEETLQDTVQSALKQIGEKKYSQELKKRGVSEERIRKYGFAFEGKKVLIG